MVVRVNGILSLYSFFKYNFRAEKRVSSNLIGRAVSHMTLYKPLQAVYIAF